MIKVIKKRKKLNEAEEVQQQQVQQLQAGDVVTAVNTFLATTFNTLKQSCTADNMSKNMQFIAGQMEQNAPLNAEVKELSDAVSVFSKDEITADNVDSIAKAITDFSTIIEKLNNIAKAAPDKLKPAEQPADQQANQQQAQPAQPAQPAQQAQPAAQPQAQPAAQQPAQPAQQPAQPAQPAAQPQAQSAQPAAQ